MASQVKAISNTQTWKQFTSFALTKISENVLDMVVNIATVGMLLSYLLLTQPVAAYEYGGFIVAIFICLLFLRLVQDFDDSYTNDELAERIMELEEKIVQLSDYIKNNG